MQVLAPVYGLTDAAESARRLEAAGVDGVFTFEGPHDVFLPLALAAAATDLAVMTNVAIAFPRNTIHLAHAAWDMHTLSEGRFTLGLGAQIRTHNERRFGVDFEHPAARMQETVEAVRAVFASWQDGVPLRYVGRYRTHTLMTPMFSPQPSPWGPPAVAVGGLGPRMCAVAAEVADALAVMPVTSERFFAERTLPAVSDGLARRDGALGSLEVLPELIVCCGRDQAEQAEADAGCRALLGFYSSTPAYRPVLDHEGFGDIQPVAQQMTREGRWDELTSLVPDDMLATIAVRGTPSEVGDQIARRYADHAHRVCVYLPYGASDELWGELVDELHARPVATP